MTPALLVCLVLSVHDGDTLKANCAGRIERIRMAAIDARELDGSCHRECAPMTAAQSRDYLDRWVRGQTIGFTIVGQSGKRLVGENYALRCQLLKVGAVVAWPSFERRYGLTPCDAR